MRGLGFIAVILFTISIASAEIIPAGQYEYLVPPRELWECFDYSMNYANNNSGWEMVVFSPHPMFAGWAHMVNYQIMDNGTLYIHDEMIQQDYIFPAWTNKTLTGYYFYFYLNGEHPTRYFRKVHNEMKAYEQWKNQTGLIL